LRVMASMKVSTWGDREIRSSAGTAAYTQLLPARHPRG
jgi:hypothetical protein